MDEPDDPVLRVSTGNSRNDEDLHYLFVPSEGNDFEGVRIHVRRVY